MAQYGPPSIAGSIDSFVDTAIGGIKDWRTGQLLESLPKTADGSVDYRAAAAAMYRTNPGLAAQFLKMEELKGLQDYRRQSLDIQRGHLDVAKDKSSTTIVEGKAVTRGPDGRITQVIDVETGQDITGSWGRPGQPAPQQQTPPSPVNTGVGKQPTPQHLQILQADPGKAAMFDEVYGPGSAARYLSGGSPADPRQQPPAVTPPAPPQPPAEKPASTAAPILQPPPGLSYSQRQEWNKNRIKEQSGIDNVELKKADDAIQSGRNTLTTIGEMLELNKRAFHGPAAQLRGTISSLTGIGGKQAGADTVILQNKITGGALEQLRATFGGNPTEGERAILLQVQGSVGQAADVRERIFKDAAELVRRRIKFNQKYANAQRKGQFMDPNYTDNTPVD